MSTILYSILYNKKTTYEMYIYCLPLTGLMTKDSYSTTGSIILLCLQILVTLVSSLINKKLCSIAFIYLHSPLYSNFINLHYPSSNFICPRQTSSTFICLHPTSFAVIQLHFPLPPLFALFVTSSTFFYL